LTQLVRSFGDSSAALQESAVIVAVTERRAVRGQIQALSVTTYHSIRTASFASCSEHRWVAADTVLSAYAFRLTESVAHWQADGRLHALRTALNKPTKEDRTLYISARGADRAIETWRGGLLSGYLPGDKLRIDLLLDRLGGTVKQIPITIDGVDCFGVTAVDSDWRYTVWFAPSRGGAILRVLRVRDGTMMNHWHEEVQRGSKERLERPLRITQEVSDVRLSKIGDAWIPVAARFTETIEHPTGPPTTTFQSVERMEVQLNPSASFVPPPPVVPNGTRVEFVGQRSPFIHEWRDGQILPREDAKATAQLRELAHNRRFVPYQDKHAWLHELKGPLLLGAPVLLLIYLLRGRSGSDTAPRNNDGLRLLRAR